MNTKINDFADALIRFNQNLRVANQQVNLLNEAPVYRANLKVAYLTSKGDEHHCAAEPELDPEIVEALKKACRDTGFQFGIRDQD